MVNARRIFRIAYIKITPAVHLFSYYAAYTQSETCSLYEFFQFYETHEYSVSLLRRHSCTSICYGEAEHRNVIYRCMPYRKRYTTFYSMLNGIGKIVYQHLYHTPSISLEQETVRNRRFIYHLNPCRHAVFYRSHGNECHVAKIGVLILYRVCSPLKITHVDDVVYKHGEEV